MFTATGCASSLLSRLAAVCRHRLILEVDIGERLSLAPRIQKLSPFPRGGVGSGDLTYLTFMTGCERPLAAKDDWQARRLRRRGDSLGCGAPHRSRQHESQSRISLLGGFALAATTVDELIPPDKKAAERHISNHTRFHRIAKKSAELLNNLSLVGPRIFLVACTESMWPGINLAALR